MGLGFGLLKRSELDLYVKEVYENRAGGLGMAAFAKARRTELPLFFQLRSKIMA